MLALHSTGNHIQHEIMTMAERLTTGIACLDFLTLSCCSICSDALATVRQTAVRLQWHLKAINLSTNDMVLQLQLPTPLS